jgi:SAM-dependent methyltransferase
VPAPRWFWRFTYDRESASWERRRDEPEHRRLVERTVDELCRFVPPPGPVADLGCGPGAHARELARRGYEVTGLDGSSRMVAVARDRAERDDLDGAFEVADVGDPLPFADGSLGGVLAVLVIQHLSDPASFVAEIRRCLRPGGHVLLTAPDRRIAPVTAGSVYWRLRALVATRVPGVIRFYDRRSLRTLVEAQGFTVEEHGDLGLGLLIARAGT